MNFKVNEKFFTRVLTFIPPLFGIVIFTYIVKYSGIDSVQQRIPLFQGLTAYFSLLLLGFTYVKNRQNIYGRKMIFLLLLIVLFPIFFYSCNGISIILTFLFVTIQLLISIILYISIVKGNMIRYLVLACINSVIMPLTLAINVYMLIFLCVFLFVLFLCLFLPAKSQFGLFNYKESGLNFLKSVFFQSPLIILPFFDFKIAELIGTESYSNYVVYYKYINGIIVLFFSYRQLNLTFTGELSKRKQIIFQLILILIALLVAACFGNFYSFVISIVLYSIGINLSSLLIRNALMESISFYYPIVGISFTLLYAVIVSCFGSFILISNSIFVVLMYISTLIPAISFSVIKIMRLKIYRINSCLNK